MGCVLDASSAPAARGRIPLAAQIPGGGRAAAAAAAEALCAPGLPPRREPEAERRDSAAPRLRPSFQALHAPSLKEENGHGGFYLHFHDRRGALGVPIARWQGAAAALTSCQGRITKDGLSHLVPGWERRNKSNF